jgi:initiation factor 1A
MVKNITGGSKHKSFARKGASDKGKTRLRLSEDPAEKYAHVTKMYGEMCDVLCDDNKSRKCFIRGKFRGKGKRNSIILVGSVVLIGMRDWSSDDNKCDLLEVYTDQEVLQLKNHPKVPTAFLSLLISSSDAKVVTEDDSEMFEFSNIIKTADESIMPTHTGKDDEVFILDTIDEINIDDI